MSIRLVVADDHLLVREGVRFTCRQTEDIEVVGEAKTGHETVQRVRELEPDVLVLDIRLPDMTGLEVLECLAQEELEPAVVVFSAYRDSSYITRALSYNVSSYLLKGSSAYDLIATVREAAGGHSIGTSPETRQIAGVLTHRARRL